MVTFIEVLSKILKLLGEFQKDTLHIRFQPLESANKPWRICRHRTGCNPATRMIRDEILITRRSLLGISSFKRHPPTVVLPGSMETLVIIGFVGVCRTEKSYSTTLSWVQFYQQAFHPCSKS